jgi:hypothetical protein
LSDDATYYFLHLVNLIILLGNSISFGTKVNVVLKDGKIVAVKGIIFNKETKTISPDTNFVIKEKKKAKKETESESVMDCYLKKMQKAFKKSLSRKN